MIYFSYRYRKAGDYMKNPEKGKYLFGMLAGFGSISLSVIFFFILYRMPAIGAAVDTVTEILMPFIIGGVIAVLLFPYRLIVKRNGDFEIRTLLLRVYRRSEDYDIPEGGSEDFEIAGAVEETDSIEA